jgi:hypothetical protein
MWGISRQAEHLSASEEGPCSMKLAVERLLEYFENRALRRILRPKWEEVTGSWRELYSGEHLYQNASPCNICVVNNDGILKERGTREKELYTRSGRTT